MYTVTGLGRCGTQLFSVKHAVCCCVYLSNPEYITPVRGAIGPIGLKPVLNIVLRIVGRYQRGNQSLYIEEEQTKQWSKEKVQKDKQRSTKHTHKTKDRVTRTPLKTGG